jgi:hypothetical protein
MNYSYLSATAGSSCAAFFAGQIPKNNPTHAENVTDPKIAEKGIVKIQSCHIAIIKYKPEPKITPAIPPIMHKVTASIINCRRMA